MLEAELRKAQEEIDAVIAGWNAQLKTLYEERLLHEQAILFHELNIAKAKQLSYLDEAEEAKVSTPFLRFF